MPKKKKVYKPEEIVKLLKRINDKLTAIVELINLENKTDQNKSVRF